MATIKLGKSDKVTLVDNDVYDELNRYKWCLMEGRNTNYALRNVRISGKMTTMSMHRDILKLVRGDKRHVDHINGNGLDNRMSNLRTCTNQQNMFNRDMNKNNKSGYKGVSWKKQDKKWVAKIMKNRKTIHLGHFNCPIEAAKAYNEAAIKHHGEFAKLNEIKVTKPGGDKVE